MGLGFLVPSHRLAVIGLLASLSVVATSWDSAEARSARHSKQHTKEQAKHRVVHGRNYNPPYAAIVVDANSDQVLHEESPDEPRHPASLTKIMTLYMLFEQIEAGSSSSTPRCKFRRTRRRRRRQSWASKPIRRSPSRMPSRGWSPDQPTMLPSWSAKPLAAPNRILQVS